MSYCSMRVTSTSKGITRWLHRSHNVTGCSKMKQGRQKRRGEECNTVGGNSKTALAARRFTVAFSCVGCARIAVPSFVSRTIMIALTTCLINKLRESKGVKRGGRACQPMNGPSRYTGIQEARCTENIRGRIFNPLRYIFCCLAQL